MSQGESHKAKEISIDEIFLNKIRNYVIRNIASEEFSLKALTIELSYSRSQVHKKLKKISGKSLSVFVREIRLEKALELLKAKAGTASEIAYRTGFSSPAYFSKCFHDHYGFNPGEVANQKLIKTKSATEKISKHKVRILKIIAGSIFVMIVISVGLIVFPKLFKPSSGLEKSIAILPFIDDSPDKDNEHIINGIVQDLLIKLQSIKELRVLGWTSTEQYRNDPKPIPDIAKELKVAYIVEGNGQRYGDMIRLRVQLIEGGTDKHIWAASYDEVINGPEDIFRIQSEIATAIAEQLQAAINPEEKRLLDKIPTKNLKAYDCYLRAINEHKKHWLKWNDMAALERAEDLYHQALEFDSAFAPAYVGLASVYWQKHAGDVLEENYLDSMMILANIALSFDDQLDAAYVRRGDYYNMIHDKEHAIKEYDKALKINPNLCFVYWNSAGLYEDDQIIIEYHLKAASLNGGFYLPRIYRQIAIDLNKYSKEKSDFYLEEALKMDNDSADHFFALEQIEDINGNFEKAVEFGKRSYNLDSTVPWVIFLLGLHHSYLGQNAESLEYFKKYDELSTLSKTGSYLDFGQKFRIGYAYRMNGSEEKAKNYMDEGLRILNKLIELNRISYQDFYTLYSLGAIYAFLGEREKCYENLRLITQKRGMPKWMIKDIKNDPIFDNIRNEADFQQIVREIEAKFRAEQERVRLWLEENNIIGSS